MIEGGAQNGVEASRDGTHELEDWLERRFPGGGTRQQRAKAHLLPRVLIFVVVLIAAYLAAAAVTTRIEDMPGPRPAPLTVASVALSAVAVVAAGIGLFRIVGLARTDDPRARAARELLPALTWAQRRDLVDQLRGRRPVVAGDEVALAAVVRSHRLSMPLGWIGLGQLTGSVGQALARPDGLLGALWVTNAVVAAALLAVAVRAHLDVRAGERLGLVTPTPGTGLPGRR